MIVSAQQPDGYLNIYFTVVDPKGRFRNLRDMHEMYNAGHLIEAALAWYLCSGTRQFLDVMIKVRIHEKRSGIETQADEPKNVRLLMASFGPEDGQIRGYCGHPELELAMFRLYDVTRDPHHLAFATYLLEERGQKREVFDGLTFFEHEARVRGDDAGPPQADNWYYSAGPVANQKAIGGHSVRAFYLWTAAADAGGIFLAAARRVWTEAVARKMYVTGGFGSEPLTEAFSQHGYRLPQSSAEGGCYAETCASIGAMMCSERLLHQKLDGDIRDVLELAFLNAVLGGGSLDGKAFAYANKLATCGEEVSIRNEWFEVCCCPPNLSRTLGMLGGYMWKASTMDTSAKTIRLDVYLFVSASRTIELGGGQTAVAQLVTEMPWEGRTSLVLRAPPGWTWAVNIPNPRYATNTVLSAGSTTEFPGFLSAKVEATTTISLSFDLPVRILASHPATGADVLTVTRGPIVYGLESADNQDLGDQFPHFEGLGLLPTATFTPRAVLIHGLHVVQLVGEAGVIAIMDQYHSRRDPFVPVTGETPIRRWTRLRDTAPVFVPWFARANRGGAGHFRTSLLRAE